MQVGDLVRDKQDGDLGVIIDFDLEDDPIILWQTVGRMCTVRKMVELLNEDR